MGQVTVIAAVALLCVGLAVLDLHGVEGRMVPSRMLYARKPWCTGASGEIPGITCIRPVANSETVHLPWCTGKPDEIPASRVFAQ